MIPMGRHRRRKREEGEFPRGVLLAALAALVAAAIGFAIFQENRAAERHEGSAAALDSL